MTSPYRADPGPGATSCRGPYLPQVERRTVAVACDEPWERMVGDRCTRQCGRCGADVHDPAALGPAALEALVAQRGQRLFRRDDGTVASIDCGPARAAGARTRRHRLLAMTLGPALLVYALVIGWAAGDADPGGVCTCLDATSMMVAPPPPPLAPRADPRALPAAGYAMMPQYDDASLRHAAVVAPGP